MKIITFPQLPQTYDYDCGAKALQAVLVYYGIRIREDYVMKYAKTSKSGTPIQGIINLAKKYSLKTDAREMAIEDIKKFIKKDVPVILILQAWTKNKNINWKKDWVDGHYVVAIGYAKDKIIFEDPYSFERTYLRYNELEKRWRNIDTKSKKYFHYGIAVFGKPPKFKNNEIVHMD